MPVNTPHPDFVTNEPLWRKQRKFRDGSEAVKAAGEDYLPRLSGDEDGDYKGYKDRALFYGATGRTLQALSGAIFRKPPVIEFPDEDLLQHVGKAGESAQELIKRSTEEQLLPGRLGTLVDAAAQDNAEPYVTLYFAENIRSWATATRGESEELVEVVLEEQVESRDREDRFKVKRQLQYRVLRLGTPPAEAITTEAATADVQNELTDTAVYYQELWTEEEVPSTAGGTGAALTKTYTLKEIITPRMWGGRTLDRIPFTIFNAKNLAAKPEPGPMLELVNVNHSHYISSADLEHGRHFCALPTPVLAGFDPQFRLKIGSGIAWISENPAARAYFLEFSGAGLGHLVDGQKHKEHLMATLGARLLEEPKAGVEAADTLRLRMAGEQSALTSTVTTGSQGWTRTLQFLAEWRGQSSDAVLVQLNKDFDVAGLDPGQAQVWMLKVQAGLMSWPTYYYNMAKAEVYPEGWSQEKEEAAIEAGVPMAPPATESEEVSLDTSKENLRRLEVSPEPGEEAEAV